MKTSFERILFLGPHPDDDSGCSGTLMRFLEEGKDVSYVIFSFCEESIPRGYQRGFLWSETEAALKLLGIKQQNIYKLHYKGRYLSESRQAVLEELVTLNNRINPDLVLLPSSSDIHQDHCTVREEGLRAFKYSSILGYENMMNVIAPQHICYIEIGKEQLDKKCKLMACFESQRSRPYWRDTFLRDLAELRGVRAGKEYAEAFEVFRLIR